MRKVAASSGCFSSVPASAGSPSTRNAQLGLYFDSLSNSSVMIWFCMGASTKPSSARRIAGAATWAKLMVPYFSSAVNIPATAPGTPMDLPPSMDSFAFLEASEAYISFLAEAGATSR